MSAEKARTYTEEEHRKECEESYSNGYSWGYQHGARGQPYKEKWSDITPEEVAESGQAEHSAAPAQAAPEGRSYDGALLVGLILLCIFFLGYRRLVGNPFAGASSVPPQEQRYFFESGLTGPMEVDEAGYPKHGGMLHLFPKDIREAAERGDGMAVVRYDAALLRGLSQDLAIKEALAPSQQGRDLKREVDLMAPPAPGR